MVFKALQADREMKIINLMKIDNERWIITV